MSLVNINAFSKLFSILTQSKVLNTLTTQSQVFLDYPRIIAVLFLYE
jgi:hypothetical protein